MIEQGGAAETLADAFALTHELDTCARQYRRHVGLGLEAGAGAVNLEWRAFNLMSAGVLTLGDHQTNHAPLKLAERNFPEFGLLQVVEADRLAIIQSR